MQGAQFDPWLGNQTPYATTKTRQSQTNKYLKQKKPETLQSHLVFKPHPSTPAQKLLSLLQTLPLTQPRTQEIIGV